MAKFIYFFGKDLFGPYRKSSIASKLTSLDLSSLLYGKDREVLFNLSSLRGCKTSTKDLNSSSNQDTLYNSPSLRSCKDSLYEQALDLLDLSSAITIDNHLKSLKYKAPIRKKIEEFVSFLSISLSTLSCLSTSEFRFRAFVSIVLHTYLDFIKIFVRIVVGKPKLDSDHYRFYGHAFCRCII